MSRRKQSAPCKVGGNSPSSYSHTENDENISSLSFTCSPLDDEEDSKSSSPKSLIQNERVPIGLKAYSISSTNSSLCSSGSKAASSQEEPIQKPPPGDVKTLCLSNYSKSSDESEPKNKRFSARIRAKVISKAQTPGLENEAKSSSITLLNQSNSGLHRRNLLDKGRKLSCEEELTCPICFKTFMSRYGLLTHTEIHGTPELKCLICNLGFSRRSAFVAHQVHYHGEEKYTDDSSLFQVQNGKQRSVGSVPTGFSDLAFIDFTCKKFPAIAENLCVQQKHQLTEKDRRHFFMCKKCDVLFPTLFVLKFHLKHSHSTPNGNLSLPKLTISGKTYILNSERISFGVSIDTTSASTNPSSFLNGLMSRNFMQALQLKSVTESKDVSCANRPCAYGVDDPSIRTSPLVAYLGVPQWLRNNNTQTNWCANESEASIRPPLKMKLLRCKPVPGIDEPTISSAESYSVNNKDLANRTKTNDGCACMICGEQFATSGAVDAHRAGTTCGIGVRTSSNGRKLFWCRLCDYASFEKSTILRHQRTHTGIRPYSCKFCSLAFTTKANCERHIRKRHQGDVDTEMDVKSSVLCDQDLLKQARSGGEAVPTQQNITPSRERLFRFRCRMCRAMFSSRSNGARHVMDKHGVFSRKGANEMISCVFSAAEYHQGNEPRPLTSTSNTGTRTQKVEDFASSRKTFLGNIRTAFIAPKTAPKRRAVIQSDPRPVKVPRLIPLQQIQAYRDTAQKLHDHFRDNYSDILETMGISDYRKDTKDIRKMSSTLVSLLASTSSLLIDNAIRKSSSPASSSKSSVLNVSKNVETSFVTDEAVTDSNAFMETNESVEHHWKNDDVSDKDSAYHDLVQMYADGKWESLVASAEDEEKNLLPEQTNLRLSQQNEGFEELSQPHEDVHEKESSSDLTSIKKLVDFVHQPGPILINGYNNTKVSSGNDGKTSKNEARGKYRMVAIKPKNTETIQINSGLAWKFVPYPPEMRDEKGRYMKVSEQTKKTTIPTRSISSYLNDSTRPTMVSMSGSSNSKVTTGFEERKSRFLGNRLQYRSRKCPKCSKTFPWASSLRRHIMTHTGLKPYMCARCSMRFTTRSNLLRHAYRRHNVSRDADERHRVLIALTPRQQQEYAVTEAEQTLANPEQELNEDEEPNTPAEEVPEEVQDNDVADDDDTKNSSSQHASQVKKEADTTNKRFSCGLCGVLFANRSNVVRHLHRLHSITKDDDNFRSLLVKIDKQAPTPATILPSTPVIPPDVSSTSKDEDEDLKKLSSPVSKPSNSVKAETPNTSESPAALTPNKAFKCTICSVGFTKRNNAARHVQQQHHISRHRSNFAQLIERLNNSPENSQDEAPQESPVVKKRQEKSSTDVKPNSEQLSKAMKMHTSPPLWRSQRVAAKRKLGQSTEQAVESTPTPPKTRDHDHQRSKIQLSTSSYKSSRRRRH
uniref:Uncharacterized protein zf(C2h2)-69 n=1 Tax=Phallusia mammillata TaxID=59560 RepID=A0A6F9DQR6_9ASCI|nr:uncharacterized protein zf(c2h2)-69 [Phallusia mammillata]